MNRRKFASTPSLTQLLKEGLTAGKVAYPRTFPLALGMFALIQLGFAPIVSSQLKIIDFSPEKMSNPELLSSMIFAFIFTVLTFMVFYLGSSLSLILTASAHQKKECSLSTALLFMFSVAPRVLATSMITLILFSTGLSLSLFLGFILATFLSLYLPITIFESGSLSQALVTSVSRTLRNLTYAALVVSLIWLFMFGNEMVLEALFSLMGLGDFVNQYGIENILQMILSALIFPFSQGLIISLYFHLSRK
jgi:hypothetical protein